MKTGKKILYIATPLVLIGAIYFINRKKIQKKIASGINNSPLPEPVVATTTASSSVSAGVFPLKQGSINDIVKTLQRILGVTVDGNFGPQTAAALKAFSGKSTVASQAELDALSAKKANEQNAWASQAKAQQLLTQFRNNNLSIYTTDNLVAYGYIEDYAGAINYTNHNINMPKDKTYNNTDYKLTGYTKGGNLQMQITSGDLAGNYIINPNIITLV